MKEYMLLEKQIGYSFQDKELLKEALTHRSALHEIEDIKKHNERLEFLGDAVLELITTELLFTDYPEHPEGDLTSFRAALVRTESLAEEAMRIELGEYLYMSSGEEGTGGRTRPYILANAFEALTGALYLEHGYAIAKQFVSTELYYKINRIIEFRLDIDAKTKLQEKSQELLKSTPRYKMLHAEGPDHQKTFTMGAIIDEVLVTKATGESKQQAEQAAAQEALDTWDELVEKVQNEKNSDSRKE